MAWNYGFSWKTITRQWPQTIFSSTLCLTLRLRLGQRPKTHNNHDKRLASPWVSISFVGLEKEKHIFDMKEHLYYLIGNNFLYVFSTCFRFLWFWGFELFLSSAWWIMQFLFWFVVMLPKVCLCSILRYVLSFCSLWFSKKSGSLFVSMGWFRRSDLMRCKLCVFTSSRVWNS